MNRIKNISLLILISIGLAGCNGSSEGKNSLDGAGEDGKAIIIPKPLSFDKNMRKNHLNLSPDSPLGDYRVSLSYQGNVMAVVNTGSKNSNVRMYTKSNSKWVLSNSIVSDSRTFGAGVTVSSNGKYVFITDKYEDNNGVENTGKVLVYKYNGKEFFVAQELIRTDTRENGNFGSSISVSSNGKLLVVSAAQNTPSEGKKGGVYTYKLNENLDMWEFAQELDFNKDEPYFGDHLAVSGDGSTIIASDIYGNVYIYGNDNDKFVRKATLRTEAYISSISINQNGTSFTVSDFNSQLFHYEKKNGAYSKTLITKPISDKVYDSYPGYKFAEKAQISQSGDVILVSANSDFYAPPADSIVSGKTLTNILTKKEECSPKYSWSNETTKIKTGAILVYKRNASGDWILHQYMKPDLSKIRSYKGKDICDQDYLNGYKGERFLENGISFSLSGSSLVQTTINGNIFEYTNQQ
ncbi:hypothetical protein JS84_03985 [Vibrio vulnificus]|nr:hypothetical protein JS83_16225 [Vibrio vulnificus]KLI65648.1 hypothetical protein VVYB158_22055 [Vibrio vulnificus CladeA-yb158]KFK65879.1 hypothetical protein JS84_03985 [Vibrio vulnificus]KFK68904.1 hypothetical protein JS85_11915 [Vibrio vulnificus]KOR99231.1 hypothetical protein LO82_04310 [Vibrio vulnificus]